MRVENRIRTMTVAVNLAALYLSGKSLSQAQNQVITWIKFYMDNRIQDCKYQKIVQKNTYLYAIINLLSNYRHVINALF